MNSSTPDIDHGAMVAKLFKTAESMSLTVSDINYLHATQGLAGEAGEILQALSDSRYVTFDFKKVVEEEAGDYLFYLEALCQQMSTSVNKFLESPAPAMHPSYTIIDCGIDLEIRTSNIVDLIKKMVFNNRAIPFEDIEAEVKHCIDSLYLILKGTYSSIDKARQGNIRKLAKRYEGFVYSDEAAAARADKA